MTTAANRIAEFDVWRPDYGGKLVSVYAGGTTGLAALYLDIGLSEPAANPQTLLALDVDNVVYGRFQQPVYCAGPYSLEVDGDDRTGIQVPPLSSLDGEDATNAVATSASGSHSRTLGQHFNDFIIALDQGELGTTPSTNTDTIAAAIGLAAANSGGVIILPGGDVPFTQLQLNAGVRLRGAGRVATRLWSTVAGSVCTIQGDRAGLEMLTLDGVSLQTGSVGLDVRNRNEPWLRDVEIKRFDKGFRARAMQRMSAKDLYVNSCNTNVDWSGDTNAHETNNTGLILGNRWEGGAIALANQKGLSLTYTDAELVSNVFRGVLFDTNLSAIYLRGSRFTHFPECRWTGNATNLDADDSPVTTGNPRDHIEVLHLSGSMQGGAVVLTGTCFDVQFEAVDLNGVAFTLTQPANPILLRDCIEDAAVTISGDTTKLIRQYSDQHGAVDGVTTDNVATKAWGVTLAHGEVIGLRVTSLALGTNNVDHAAFTVDGTAYRPPATLAYKTQTVNFTVGQKLTGGTSGASALIVADADAGATGTLSLIQVSGTFQVNETITDALGGTAAVQSVLAPQNVAVQNQAKTSTYTSTAGCDTALVADGGDIEVQVTGLAAKRFLWTVQVEATRTS